MSALALVLAGSAAPAFAQDADARLRRMEAEIRALQRQVFPGGGGKLFTPEIGQPQGAGASAAGQPATSPLTDLLTRMQALEAQIARLTSQTEQNTNRIAQLEARAAAGAAAATVQAAGAPTPLLPPPATPAPAATAASPAAAPPAAAPVAAPAPAPVAAPVRAAAPAPAPAAPSAQRVAAVRAIVKPQTGDPGDDEYSYGFRLWEAKFYPEAQQQLKIFVDRYPRHARISFGRNLLGRAYLDDGKPREAAPWFLQNYQNDKRGARSPDSLLYLAAAMVDLKDTSRACIALAEFAETYAAEAAGRLNGDYDTIRGRAKCN